MSAELYFCEQFNRELQGQLDRLREENEQLRDVLRKTEMRAANEEAVSAELRARVAELEAEVLSWRDAP
jgi:Tfp pilus assembly protein PilO